MSPPGYLWIFINNFNQFGPAACPSIADIYINTYIYIFLKLAQNIFYCLLKLVIINIYVREEIYYIEFQFYECVKRLRFANMNTNFPRVVLTPLLNSSLIEINAKYLIHAILQAYISKKLVEFKVQIVCCLERWM